MTHFITDIESQTVTLDGRIYTAANCRHRLYEDFCRRYGPDSFHACLAAFLREWFDASDTVCVHTSGSTGTPKELRVEKRRMMASAMMTVDFLGLRRGDAALLCMPLQYIAGKMVVVRALVSGLNLLPVTPSGHPLKALHEAPAFAAMIPMQVFNALQVPAERALLKDIRQLIIGGGSIDASMSEALQDFPHAVWSTYGMTETLSHIAMRRLNGPQASAWYTPFPGVRIPTSPEGTLAIHAPAVNPDLLVTNDLVEFDAQGRFRILGRRDNTINTGGVKVQIEQVEDALRPHLPFPFAITSVPDAKFGERIVLLVENVPADHPLLPPAIAALPPYWRPKQVFSVPQLPQTGTGKPDRATARRLARSIQPQDPGTRL